MEVGPGTFDSNGNRTSLRQVVIGDPDFGLQLRLYVNSYEKLFDITFRGRHQELN